LEGHIHVADFVQLAEGKLNSIGAGWTLTGPGVSNFGLGGWIEVEWNDFNTPHLTRLTLQDADGRVVIGGNGGPVDLPGGFNITPGPDHPVGLPIKWPVAIMFLGMMLQPGSQYRFVLSVDDKPVASVGFSTRALASVN
jgi:hypothetical protein